MIKFRKYEMYSRLTFGHTTSVDSGHFQDDTLNLRSEFFSHCPARNGMRVASSNLAVLGHDERIEK